MRLFGSLRLQDFAASLVARLNQAGLGRDFGKIDHVCYRVQSLERYEAMKEELDTTCELLSEAWINGRPIATYKFQRPFQVGPDLYVDVVELPAPKEGKDYVEGFEHIEVVTHDPLPALLAKHPTLSFDRGNLKAEVNRDVSLLFPEGMVKFHEQSLEKVITVEKAAIKARKTQPLAIFDFDDTLVSSRDAFLKTMQATLSLWFSQPISTADVVAKARPTFPEFLAQFSIHDPGEVQALVRSFQDLWPQLASECTVPTGIRTLLSCLRAEGVQIQVWTARDPKTTTSVLAETGLAQYVATVHGYDGKEAGKPHPNKALQDACAAASRTVLVGDSITDRLAAEALGVRFLQGAWITKSDLGVPQGQVCETPLAVLRAFL